MWIENSTKRTEILLQQTNVSERRKEQTVYGI